MKTTSYEISKKLEEAGFKASYIYAWYSDSEGLPWVQEIQHVKPTAINKYGKEVKLTFMAPAYDLETLLDALPDSITREYKSKEDGEIKEFKERLIIEKEEIRYSCDDIENADDTNRYYQEYGYMQDISVFKKFNDNSLADMAGKMWLMLKQKGIIC